MQSRLTDVNTAVIKYRNLATAEIDDRNYGRAFGACYAINSVMPEKYQIKISTEEYEKITKTDIIFICNKCEKDTNKNDIKISERIGSLIQQLLIKQEKEKVWSCPNCEYENRLVTTKMKQTKFNQPHYLQVVPNPPERRDGMITRIGYHNKAEQWVWQILEELEFSLATWRDDYMKANREEFEENSNDDDLQ